MSSVREKILEAQRLKRMRLGQEVCEFVEFVSVEDLRLALVPLNDAEVQSGVIAAAELDLPDNFATMQARNHASQASDVWNALRDPQDWSVKAFASVHEMQTTLDPADIENTFDQLTVLMTYASPTLDGLSDEVLAALKDNFAQMDLNALSGRARAALRLFFSLSLPDVLRANSSGSTSTDSSTEKNESEESTTSASPS